MHPAARALAAGIDAAVAERAAALAAGVVPPPTGSPEWLAQRAAAYLAAERGVGPEADAQRHATGFLAVLIAEAATGLNGLSVRWAHDNAKRGPAGAADREPWARFVVARDAAQDYARRAVLFLACDGASGVADALHAIRGGLAAAERADDLRAA